MQEEKSFDRKKYEIAFLARSKEAAEGVLRLARQHSAEIVSDGGVQEIKLAYKVEQLERTLFGYLHLRSLPDEIKKIEKDLGVNRDIVRFLIVNLPPESSAVSAASDYKQKEERHPPKKQKETVSVRPRPQALSNEALEKKIEEILQ